MDCRDRFAVWLVELVLEPVRALAEADPPAEATVRAAHGERRFDVTISRGGDGAYAWSFREAPAPRQLEPPELLTGAGGGESDPEAAFWAAWSAIDERSS